MIYSLFDNADQNKDYSNIQYPKENLVNMKKGVMINGSEVYYGKGKKVDVKNNYNRINSKFNGQSHTSYNISSYNQVNQIKKYEQITYTVKEEKKIIKKIVKHGKPIETKKEEKKIIKKIVNNGKPIEIKEETICENKEMDFKVDDTQPRCSVSVRLYKGDIVKGEFNCNQKFGDVYSLVKKISKNNNFVLLEGFPPKPLIEYGKTISELGLENSILTQRII